MNFSFLEDNDLDKTVLSIEQKNYTLKALKKKVNELVPSFDSNFIIIKAKRDLSFFTHFLFSLENKIPICILPENYTDQKVNEYKDLISNSSINPQTALLLLTSGSSGQPKIVQLSLKNIVSNTKAIITCLDFENIQSQALFLPMSYSFGILGQFLPALLLRKKSYVLSHFIQVKKLLEENNIQMISGVPSHHIGLLKTLTPLAKKNLTHIISAGAPLSIKLRQEMINFYDAKATIYNNYGQTELSPRALVLSSKDPHFLKGGVGRIVPGLQARISPKGELEFQGDQVMLGYLTDKNNSDNGESNWHNTHDFSELKGDVYYINGRSDDLVKIRGERISLKIVQEKFEKLNGVSRAVIIVKQDKLDENYLALFYTGTATETEIISLKDKSSINYFPREIMKLESFPTNTNGKIDTKKLMTL